jgi:hypothetical protein
MAHIKKATVIANNHDVCQALQATGTDTPEAVTRMIDGLGSVAAQYTGSAGHLEWQITDLHGDVVAMAFAGISGLSSVGVSFIAHRSRSARFTPSGGPQAKDGARVQPQRHGGVAQLVRHVRQRRPLLCRRQCDLAGVPPDSCVRLLGD